MIGNYQLNYQLNYQPKNKTLVFMVNTRVYSGVGGTRTLVQTSNQRAFYTLSLYLSFRL